MHTHFAYGIKHQFSPLRVTLIKENGIWKVDKSQ